jgi:hypothetical protein
VLPSIKGRRTPSECEYHDRSVRDAKSLSWLAPSNRSLSSIKTPTAKSQIESLLQRKRNLSKMKNSITHIFTTSAALAAALFGSVQAQDNSNTVIHVFWITETTLSLNTLGDTINQYPLAGSIVTAVCTLFLAVHFKRGVSFHRADNSSTGCVVYRCGSRMHGLQHRHQRLRHRAANHHFRIDDVARLRDQRQLGIDAGLFHCSKH